MFTLFYDNKVIQTKLINVAINLNGANELYLILDFTLIHEKLSQLKSYKTLFDHEITANIIIYSKHINICGITSNIKVLFTNRTLC